MQLRSCGLSTHPTNSHKRHYTQFYDHPPDHFDSSLPLAKFSMLFHHQEIPPPPAVITITFSTSTISALQVFSTLHLSSSFLSAMPTCLPSGNLKPSSPYINPANEYQKAPPSDHHPTSMPCYQGAYRDSFFNPTLFSELKTSIIVSTQSYPSPPCYSCWPPKATGINKRKLSQRTVVPAVDSRQHLAQFLKTTSSI